MGGIVGDALAKNHREGSPRSRSEFCGGHRTRQRAWNIKGVPGKDLGIFLHNERWRRRNGAWPVRGSANCQSTWGEDLAGKCRRRRRDLLCAFAFREKNGYRRMNDHSPFGG